MLKIPVSLGKDQKRLTKHLRSAMKAMKVMKIVPRAKAMKSMKSKVKATKSSSSTMPLPKGWRIHTSERSSGASAGQKIDKYYVSPEGKVCRSKIEMAAYLKNRK